MIKKRIIIVLTLLLMPIVVSAKEFNIFDMSINIDDEVWAVYEVDKLETNPHIIEAGYTSKEIKKQNESFKKEDKYLEAYDEVTDLSILIVIKKTEDMSEKDFNDSFKEIKKEFKEDSRLKEVKEDTINGKKFISYKIKENGDNILAYVTVVNDKRYTFQLNKSDTFNSSDEVIFKTIMKTVSFNKKKEKEISNNSISTKEEKVTKDNKSVNKILINIISYTLIIAIVSTFSGKLKEKQKKNKKKISTKKRKKNH